MGIKEVWNILQPYCERKPLSELENKRVAIDLSGWVCQAQCITEYQVQPKMYLRNLYFRTCYLLLHDVQCVFVLEGKAPTLKYKTLAARNELQPFKGARPRANKKAEVKADKQPNKGRNRFDSTLKQCKEMLRIMGLACVTGYGEAEAMCAYLNQKGLVAGCVSQDSDCFAYGARIVYRNFSISTQGCQAGGSIDIYDLRKSELKFDFGRNKIIAMALLCGSDYNDGVAGVGKESALKYFATVKDIEVLDKLRAWRTNNATCFTTVRGLYGKQELMLRKKALADENFPDEELISEFLICKESVDSLDVSWQMPNIEEFIDFTRRHLQWEEIYAFEKFLPILARWIILNPNSKDAITSPDYIKKSRTPKGIPSYEIVWKSDNLKTLFPKEQMVSATDLIKVFSTIEPKHLVDQYFPDLVETFNESRKKPKKKQAKKDKKIPECIPSRQEEILEDDDYSSDINSIIDDIIGTGVPSIFKRKVNSMFEAATTPPTETSFFDFCPTENEVDHFERSMVAYDISSSSESDDD